jgi:hypothetical protein
MFFTMRLHSLSIFKNKAGLARVAAILALLLAMVPAQMAGTDKGEGAAAVKNSWRGITPLRSDAADVAQAIGIQVEPDAMPGGPYRTDDGEVTFSYITPSLAKIYRAPRSMVGKVFTIYFKPDSPVTRAGLKLAPGFKRCTEELGKSYYYFVNDAGVAYQLRRADDHLEAIIYQPTRAETSRLAVNTECVF